MSVTPNMGMVLPTPETTLGPEWAEELNTALDVVDVHDHTAGNGVLITPAAMLINALLNFNSNLLYGLLAAGLNSQGSATTTANFLGSVQNIGGNLYWVNNAGQSVQITSGSAIVSPGSGALVFASAGASPYSVTTGDAQRILGVSTAAAYTLNLPPATDAMFFMAKDVTGSAQTNNISVVPDGTDTIEGVNGTYICNTGFGAWGFISDGVSAWYVV
jgi:hypothetical protein